jgi:signal transduction histidine kinase
MRLADDFVQLARAEEAALPSDPVDLASLTVEAADDLWPVAKARGQRIDTEVTDEEVLIAGDAELLGRALRNLIDNASKYSPEGAPIRASVAIEGGRAVCRIADAGRGMSADEAARLFQPFERFSGGDGAGLGLTFVQTVVQRHGGTIAVDSAPGAGTTFTLHFPQARDG